MIYEIVVFKIKCERDSKTKRK